METLKRELEMLEQTAPELYVPYVDNPARLPTFVDPPTGGEARRLRRKQERKQIKKK